MITYYIVAAGAVLITAISQVLLKIGANRSMDRSFISSYFNAWTMSGYFLFVVVTLMNLYAFKEIPFKMAVILVPFTYVFVSMFSVVLLEEKMAKNQILGACIILVGVIVFNF
jgi:drug/metabolite transporter (DMT)-like permease